MAHASPELPASLLKQVSRSFYLTLRILPGAIRPQIGLAYLLARAADTIADTEVVSVPARLEALQILRERIMGQGRAPLNFASIIGAGPSGGPSVALRPDAPAAKPSGVPSAAELLLLEQVENILSLIHQFSAEDQRHIREVLQTITSGQALDVERFAGATSARIVALDRETELDDYTYRVAGCVGEFWTRICRAHLFPTAPLDEASLLANGVRFGKGLQMVNILRDLPVDLRLGRCYLPAEELGRLGLKPESLLERANYAVLRPLYQRYLDLAQAHLAAGWAYTNALPRGCVRVRLACAWPVLFGVRTLDRLRSAEVLGTARPIKISRSEVRGLIVRSIVYYPWPKAWNVLFHGVGASERQSIGAPEGS